MEWIYLFGNQWHDYKVIIIMWHKSLWIYCYFLITSEVCSEWFFLLFVCFDTAVANIVLLLHCVFYLFLFKCDYHHIWLYVDSFGTIVEFVRGGTGVAVQNPLRSVIWTVLFSKDTSSKSCLTEWGESSIRCVNLRCLLICVTTWQKGITEVVSTTALVHYIPNLYICSFKDMEYSAQSCTTSIILV